MTHGVSLIDESLNPDGSTALFTDEQWLEALLETEAALARAQAAAGLIPGSAAEAISRACHGMQLDRAQFIESARRSGALAIGLVAPIRHALTEIDPGAVPYLHFGSTTQDAVDTAHAVLTRVALEHVLAELQALCAALGTLARKHAATPMLARSLLQPAQVTSFGLKCAQSLAAIHRSMGHLRNQAPLALCVQLGGPVGNRGALGEQAEQVEQSLAQELGLWACGQSRHTQRDAWLRLAMEAAVCSGTLAKLARDWSLLSQFEVGEVNEAPRGRTSSAMPHKRNAVFCMQAIAQTQSVPGLAANLLGAMAQAHERALGEWQAELSNWAPLWRRVHAAASALRRAAETLEVDAPRMQHNIAALHEVVYSESCVEALAPLTGLEAAQGAVERLAPEALGRRTPLSDLLLQWIEEECGVGPALSAAQALRHATDPNEAVLASSRACHALLRELDENPNPIPGTHHV